MRSFYIGVLAIFIVGCNNHHEVRSTMVDSTEIKAAGDSLKKLLDLAVKNTDHSDTYTGKFFRIDKLSEEDYMLLLQDSADDHIDTFRTQFPLHPDEIEKLAKKGNSISVTYRDSLYPGTGSKQKYATSLAIIYGQPASPR